MLAGSAAPVGTFMAGVWSWIARELATSIVAAQENLRRRPGPWDRRPPAIYVSGCEIICVPDKPMSYVKTRA
jgi:hypothetical protein